MKRKKSSDKDLVALTRPSNHPSNSDLTPKKLYASGITLLVANHERFGFSERACYHFDRIETLTQKPKENDSSFGENAENVVLPLSGSGFISPHEHKIDENDDEKYDSPNVGSNDSVENPFARPNIEPCGIISLLECTPEMNELNAKSDEEGDKKRERFQKISEFNKKAGEERDKHLKLGQFYCHQPKELPLQLNFNKSIVTFAYEMTRMVFCIDASPTLTSTFGNTGHTSPDGAVCALDRLDAMVRTFLNGLVVPMSGGNAKKRANNNIGSGSNERWVPEIVVTVIASYPPALVRGKEEKLSILVSDFRVHDSSSANLLSDRIVDWATIEIESEIASRMGRIGGRLDCSVSSIRDIIDQCYEALKTMPPRGRPIIVLATDCRAVNCESILDLVRDKKVMDTPFNVLDLSGSHSFRNGNRGNVMNERAKYLLFEADSPSEFPLIVPDDGLALRKTCEFTRGNFINAERLQEAVNTFAGNKATSFVQPNSLQFQTFFSLSPFCPQDRHTLSKPKQICTYPLNPIRAKGILIMRIMDGYRLKQFGNDTQCDDKVSMQFELELEFGVVLHYQFEYEASPSHNAMVGSAKVIISISGEPTVVEMVKKKWESTSTNFGLTLKNKTCDSICQFLKWIEEEDVIESKICALDWKDKLVDESDFLKILADLDKQQLYRHFRYDSFEISRTRDAFKHSICDSTTQGDSEAERQIIETVSAWSTRAVIHGNLYLRLLPTSEGNLTNYCLIEIKSSKLSQLFPIYIHYFEQVDTNVRISSSKSLQSLIESYANLFIAPRPLNKRVLSHNPSQIPSSLHHNEYWELLREPELLLLAAKRRSYFDNFVLVKFIPMEEVVMVTFVPDNCNRLYLVIYRLVVLSDKAVAHMIMDREQGVMSYLLLGQEKDTAPPLFTSICLNVKERDHKCVRALRSRRNLLSLLDGTSVSKELIVINHAEDVKRLLLYATRASKRMRFFNELFGNANAILENMTIDFMLSEDFSFNVAEIHVGDTQGIGEMGQGRWFLVRFDSDSDLISMVHFPFNSVKNQDGSASFRELSFFTVAFADLYYYKADDFIKRSDGEDADTLIHVSKFFADLEAANKHHYVTAAYRALRNPQRDVKETLTNSDITAMMECCINVPIVEDIEIKEYLRPTGEMLGPKTMLTTLLSSMLSPIPGGSPCFYFCGNENAAMDENLGTESNGNGIDHIISGDIDAESDTNIPISTLDSLKDAIVVPSYQAAVPIFILLTMDGEPATLSDISCIDRSVSLSAFLTVFKTADTGKKTELQKAISSLLKFQLDSYIAEQTLEQLLWEGRKVTEVDLDMVKLQLSKAKNVVPRSIVLKFYNPNTDSMIDTSSSIDLQEGLYSYFYLLCSCLAEQSQLIVSEASSGQFFVTDTVQFGWCYIHIPETLGPVSVYTFHHNGIRAAERTAELALNVLKSSCHKVNQISLLETMQRTRAASDLLIPADNDTELSVPKDTTLIDSEGLFHAESDTTTLDLKPGFFRCNIAHRAFYPLHPRCLASEAIHHLQYTTMLKSLEVSNRRGIFVYKDECEQIFYMSFEPYETDSLRGIGIELQVYGIHEAGTSITHQLDCLLKKEVMTLAVEEISTALAKSQYFNLPQSDIDFVKTFETKRSNLDKEHFSPTKEEIYEFPVAVYDPVLVLLCFRQNVSGSTFFNVWRRPRQTSPKEELILSDERHDSTGSRTGIPFKFDHRDFSLCYNATQFQLNPEFQAISTLTAKGKEYSRKAGTGMALIEIKLLDPDQPLQSAQIDKALVGKIPGQEFDVLKSLQSLRFKKLEWNGAFQRGRSRLSVRVFNTTLHADSIYRWIELTLNQALVSWVIERHLERARLGLCRLPIGIVEDKKERNLTLPISKICPGLTSLGSFLTTVSRSFPHPAVNKLDFYCAVKATEVASLSLHCLERCILGPLFGNKRKIGAKDIVGLQMLRVCQSHTTPIDLKYSDPPKAVQVYSKDKNEVIIDRPMDSPQIIIVYGLNKKTEEVRRKDLMERTQSQYAPPPGSFLFQKVSIDDFLSDKMSGSLSNALRDLMKEDPYAFMRRVAFILTVNRSGVSALFYNLNPQTVQSINLKLTELHGDFLKQTTERTKVQQSRHSEQSYDSSPLGLNLPSTSNLRGGRRVSTNSERRQVASIPEGNESVSTTQPKKKRTLLKPTIVGTSAKGSAYQAHLHMRARASTTRSASKIVQGRSNPQRMSNQKARDNLGSKVANKAIALQQDKDKFHEDEHTHLPPQLKKMFASLQSFIVAKSLRRMYTIGLHQSTLMNWFLGADGNDIELPFLAIKIILKNATALQTSIFPLIPSAVTNATHFLIYFSKTAFPSTSKFPTIYFHAKHNGSLERRTKYFMQKAFSTKTSHVYVMHELSVFSLKGVGRIGKCKSWAYTEHRKTKETKNWMKGPSPQIVHRSSEKSDVYKREKASNKLSNITALSLVALQPSLKMFMYALNILRRFATGDVNARICPSPTQLLHETMTIFPAKVQLNSRIGHWYRLLRRTVLWENTEFQAFGEILKHICFHPIIYEVKVCENDKCCFSGAVPCGFKDVYFFFSQGREVSGEPISFQLHVLCCTRGSTLERYVFDDGLPIAKQLSDHLLDKAEAKIHDLAEKASILLKRDGSRDKV